MKALVKLSLFLYSLTGNYFYTRIRVINNETSGHKVFIFKCRCFLTSWKTWKKAQLFSIVAKESLDISVFNH